MNIKRKSKSDCNVELDIKLKWSEIEKDYFTELDKILANTKQKGARKGKLVGIQRELFIKNNKDYIKATFVDYAINAYYKDALKNEKIIPLNQAKITDLHFDGEGTDFKFKIEFEVRPDIGKKIPNYEKKVTIKTTKYIVSDNDEKRAIEDIRMRHAKARTVERPLKSGDFIYADFNKLDDDGKIVEGGVLPNHHIRIGEGLFSGELEKPFLNKKADDEINVSIDQEHGKVKYLVKINKIEEQVLPDITDKFVMQVDPELKKVKEFKSKVRENIQLNLNNENVKEFHNKIVEYFIEKTKCDVPLSMVENYKKYLIEESKAKSPDTFDEEKMDKEISTMSNNNIKWLLIREYLAEKEKLFVSMEDVENEVKRLMEQSPNYKKDIKKFYAEDQNKNKLRDDILNGKIFNYLEGFFINKSKEVSTDKIKQKK